MPALTVLSTDCFQLLVITYLFIYSFTRYLLVSFMWNRMINKTNRGSCPQGALKSNLIQGCQVQLVVWLCTTLRVCGKKISGMEFPTPLTKLLSPRRGLTMQHS